MAKAKKISILELREVTLATVAYKGSFQGIGKAYAELMKWARAHGFTNSKKNKTLTIYHDDPDVVGVDHVRQSASMITDKPFEPMNNIKKLVFNAGTCAVGRYEISFSEFKDAWTEMKNFVDNHELDFSMAGSFEVYQPKRNNKIVVDICIPVKKD